jgi:pimeloyl-ACP methyl ester carboxylesterase
MFLTSIRREPDVDAVADAAANVRCGPAHPRRGAQRMDTSPTRPTGSRERTLDEVKAEVLRRAGKFSPFESIRPQDAAAAMGALTSLERDHWAAQWSRIGLAYEAEADARAKAGAGPAELAERYLLGFDTCRVGRYPAPTSSGQLAAYHDSLRIFRKGAQYLEPRLEIIELPCEGKTLVGHLQLPPGVKNPPVVMHWGGVDGWKEDRLHVSGLVMDAGLASLAVDMPGSGENPFLYGDAAAERSYLAWLDYLARRPDVDGRRVGVWGGSFGAYWAARLAHVAPERIAAAVFHGGNVHYGFQPEWLVPAFTTGGATYLFGAASLLDARGRAVGTTTLAEFLAAVPRFSLLTMGLLDKPCAPLLCVNGKLDDQAPIDDVYLLMEHGSPKSARIYGQGHHMGRTPGVPYEDILKMIVEWLRGQLARDS